MLEFCCVSICRVRHETTLWASRARRRRDAGLLPKLLRNSFTRHGNASVFGLLSCLSFLFCESPLRQQQRQPLPDGLARNRRRRRRAAAVSKIQSFPNAINYGYSSGFYWLTFFSLPRLPLRSFHSVGHQLGDTTRHILVAFSLLLGTGAEEDTLLFRFPTWN